MEHKSAEKNHKYSRGLSFRPFEFPAEVSFALVNFENGWIWDKLHSRNKQKTILRIMDFYFHQDWEIINAAQDVVLLKKGHRGKLQLLEHSKSSYPLPTDRKSFVIDDTLTLLAYQIDTQNFGRKELLPITFFWKSNRDMDIDYRMVIILKQGQKNIVVKNRWIGYSICPTSLWRKDDYFKERYWLDLLQLKPGIYSLEIKFYKSTNKEALAIKETSSPSKEWNTLFVGNISVK